MNALILSASGVASGIKPLKGLSDALKAVPEGLYRSAYFFEETENAEQLQQAFNEESIVLSGPMTVVHAIRRASDLLLEECGYEGLQIHLEVEGKRVPELPGQDELLQLLAREHTHVVVDGRPYRPNQEVFGFQAVYDDTTRFIESLKTLGISNDAMFLLATPDEIAIEIHPGVFGCGGHRQLGRMYRALIGRIAGIKRGDRRLMKTTDRTILPEMASATTPVLVPGSIHPGLHRPKVGVSQSHFAYGPAAFSDYCGKKRTLDECLKEVRTWIKFLESTKEPVQKLKEVFAGLAASVGETRASAPAPVATPASLPSTAAPLSQPAAPLPTLSTREIRQFRPLKLEAPELVSGLPSHASVVVAPGVELGKALGGGFVQRGLHLIVGGREEGKAAWMQAFALQTAGRLPVLYLSREHTMAELTLRATAWVTRQSTAENIMRTVGNGAEAQAARQKWQQTLETTCGVFPDSLYVRGSDRAVRLTVPDDIVELLKLLPPGPAGKVVFIESMNPDDLTVEYLGQLRQQAIPQQFTVFISAHFGNLTWPRPHLIEGPDLDLLGRFQGLVDTILHLSSDRLNLRRFIAMASGKVEPPMVEKLEQQLQQACSGPRLRQDTYALLRLLHARGGSRRIILSLYQRDIGRFWEGPSLPLSRP